MKNLYTFLILFLISYSLTAQWTSLVQSLMPRGFYNNSIKLAPDESIWVISTQNRNPLNLPPIAHRSVDWGQTWTNFEFTNAGFHYGFDIFPIDSMNAFAALVEGGLYKTIDGSASWQKENSYPFFPIKVHFFDENEGWILGEDAVPVRTVMSFTTDAGQTWNHLGAIDTLLPSGYSLPPLDSAEFIGITFISSSAVDIADNNIIIGRNNGNIWVSSDRGRNWERKPTPFTDTNWFAGNVTIKDKNTYMVASDADSDFNSVTTRAYITTDNGATWTPSLPGVTAAALRYLPGSDSIFVMSGHYDFGSGPKGTSISYDMGKTWSILDNEPILTLDFIDKNTGIASNPNVPPFYLGEVFSWNFPGSTDLKELLPASVLRLSPNPVRDILTVEIPDAFASKTFQAKLYEQNGSLLKSFDFEKTNQFQINVNDLPSGIYYLKVSDDKVISVSKFLK